MRNDINLNPFVVVVQQRFALRHKNTPRGGAEVDIHGGGDVFLRPIKRGRLRMSASEGGCPFTETSDIDE